MSFEDKFSLSVDDFESKRYTKVAKFIASNWPLKEKIKLSKAQEILAVTLGYEDFHDAQKSALAQLPSDVIRLTYGANNRLRKFLDLDYYGTEEFLQSWPLHLLGRWNMAGKPCMLGKETIEVAIEHFTDGFSSDLRVSQDFHVKTTPCALSLIAIELKNASDSDLLMPLKELLSSQSQQAVFDCAMKFFFSEFLWRNDELIRSGSGMSMEDVRALPRDRSSFPDLYSALESLYTVWLNEPAVNRFFRDKSESGFYFDDPHPGRLSDAKVSIIPHESGSYEVRLQRIPLDDSPFKSFRWTARSLDTSGLSLAEAEGGFVVGAKENWVGSELIEATEDCGVEAVYAYLKAAADSSVEEGNKKRLTPTRIGTGFIFEWSNLLTINYLERNDRCEPGRGLDLISAVIKDLKRRYKRDMHVCGVVDPYQFRDSARRIKSLEDSRIKTANKICQHLKRNIGFGPGVSWVFFTPGIDQREPKEYYFESVVSGFKSHVETTKADDGPFMMVWHLWLAPDFSRVQAGLDQKPWINHDKVDFQALKEVLAEEFQFGPKVRIRVANDTIDQVTVHKRQFSGNEASTRCSDFARVLLEEAHTQTGDVIDIRKRWSSLHAMPERRASPPPMLIPIVIEADDFEDALFWVAQSKGVLGIRSVDFSLAFTKEMTAKDHEGTLTKGLHQILAAQFGIAYQPFTLLDEGASDTKPEWVKHN
ncbi:hypothetical protein ACQCLI_32200 (plasmid) [Pseudomonas nitroreducens]|uniref:hypothetical protein n=1 Tax=Pseudomonas nitroreducens TaxID=46680 RepID=UPI00031D1832|nr:hypothetical protein [Pseudomonas nitroreducens]